MLLKSSLLPALMLMFSMNLLGASEITSIRKFDVRQIAQGSIIANTGEPVKNIHPIIIEGQGHTSLSNVEAFSGGNGALTTVPENMSWDFLLVRGDKKLTVSIWGSRMRNYMSNNPITVENNLALIQIAGCYDKDENVYNKIYDNE